MNADGETGPAFNPERIGETMTEKLHPGLGSGALREALAYIQHIVDHDHKLYCREGACVATCVNGRAVLALSLSSPIEPRPASERHPNSGRDKLAGEAIRELGAIEAEKPKALKWLIKWDQAKKLHPSQDVCVADLAALLVHGPQASSEVRERVRQERVLVLEDVIKRLWERMGNEEYGHAKAAVALDIEAVEEMKTEAERSLAGNEPRMQRMRT